ncbi:3-hydroxyacyl-CoA dehydrogenase NAD-binding domain-containing protein [Geothrix sp. 21YS21S-2]|uniref:3-hydroxyacyl-CoA dehydrogenase NAD-binding domain-containing protein n=1 Tax=Geothrix sp. 21YS21S-2 TaxID=3068893 RepID=UPI0027BA1946|nr:3-hydroxyacyl-CoA dehydrogenase NAD-binding domain-containing protein [Geothrix sp. 21YS21S-2]
MSTAFDGFRHWRGEAGEDGILDLVLDRAHASANTLSAEVLEELDRVLDRVAAGAWKGLVLRSGKAGGFIAGADVSEFGGLAEAGEASARIGRGQGVFAKLEALPLPTVALVHGYCLGGGLELALACRYRVASDDPGTRLGLPEVLLGIHPGFGGTVRLVRLLGPVAALDLMLTGRSVSARKAHELGLVDEVVPERQLPRAGRAALLRAAPPRRASWARRLPGIWPLRPLLARFLRGRAARLAPPAHYPAPSALIALWEAQARAPEAAYPAEARSVAQLVTGPASRNLVRVFQLQERLKDLARGGHPPARFVHVAGAGAMGGDIAAWCALQGLQVTIQDVDGPRLAQVMKRAAELFRRKLKDPRLVAAALDRIGGDLAGEGAARADVVIEAIFEDADAKRALYRTLEPRMRPEALLATNTSSIPLEELAGALEHPERFVGLHFFNPVARMQLVEVVSMASTPAGVSERAMAFVGAIRRLPLPVRSTPGFLVNRILMSYLLEAVALEGEGVPAHEIDRAALAFGMPMGPVLLADTVGLDVCLSVARILGASFGCAVPRRLEELVAAGRLGRKTGRGFYDYRGDRPRIPKASLPTPGGPVEQRLVLRLLNEAVACHRERVTLDADLLDAGMIFGTGFAPFTGGPMNHNRNEGAEVQRARLEGLEHRLGSRFAPDPGWRSLPD